jgi:hypothetical protein
VGLLRKLFGTREPSVTDVMRMDILMEYRPLEGSGRAAVQWEAIASDDLRLRPWLIALLYGRILAIHEETRDQLFRTIDEISRRNVRDEGQTGFEFPRWTLNVPDNAPSQQIWPWQLHGSSTTLSNPKVYRATLKAVQDPRAGNYFALHLDMTFGLERVLAPSSALIAIASYADGTDNEGRYELAVVLWQINSFYGEPGAVQVGTEHIALAAATAAMRAGNLRVP